MVDNIKAYADLMLMQKGSGDFEKASKISSKAMSTYVTGQFVAELMKDLKMGGDFDFLFIDAITEAIVKSDGFGTDKIFNRNRKESKYNTELKEPHHASTIDISI